MRLLWVGCQVAGVWCSVLALWGCGASSGDASLFLVGTITGYVIVLIQRLVLTLILALVISPSSASYVLLPKRHY